MKAFVIKNKDGYYLVNTFAWSRKLIHAYIDESEKGLEIVLKDLEGCTIVPIIITEEDLEEENRVLKSNFYEIWHNFATICEVCVTESKKEISSENAVEEIRNYLTSIDLCFDEIKEKLGTDYFIEQAKKGK